MRSGDRQLLWQLKKQLDELSERFGPPVESAHNRRGSSVPLTRSITSYSEVDARTRSADDDERSSSNEDEARSTAESNSASERLGVAGAEDLRVRTIDAPENYTRKIGAPRRMFNEEEPSPGNGGRSLEPGSSSAAVADASTRQHSPQRVEHGRNERLAMRAPDLMRLPQQPASRAMVMPLGSRLAIPTGDRQRWLERSSPLRRKPKPSGSPGVYHV